MATFTVTNLFDSGSGSLRNFISTANENNGADIIDFDTELEGGTIDLTSGELGISDDLTIDGLGADLLSVNAGGNSRIFDVDNGDVDTLISVGIKGLTITGGDADWGGGVLNQENLTVTNSTISGNLAESGGGIFNNVYKGSLVVNNSIISGNSAVSSGEPDQYNGIGGGIFNNAYNGGLVVNNSTISGNLAGGGIENYRSFAAVDNSTITGNSGIGMDSYRSTVTVNNSTITSNSAGGITQGSSSLTATSSIIAANTDNYDIEGGIESASIFISGGNNLIGNGDGAEGFTNGENGDIVGTAENPIDPLLGELQDNGGPTQTQALLPGSPAINAGSNPLNLKFDQRGPGFDRVVGTQADIGAVAVPEPDSTLGLLGVAVLGVMFLHKCKQKSKAVM